MWCAGVLDWWSGGAVVLWCCGAVVLWCCGAVVARWQGGKVFELLRGDGWQLVRPAGPSLMGHLHFRNLRSAADRGEERRGEKEVWARRGGEAQEAERR